MKKGGDYDDIVYRIGTHVTDFDDGDGSGGEYHRSRSDHLVRRRDCVYCDPRMDHETSF